MIFSNCTLIFLLGSNFEVFFKIINQIKLKLVKSENDSFADNMINLCVQKERTSEVLMKKATDSI